MYKKLKKKDWNFCRMCFLYQHKEIKKKLIKENILHFSFRIFKKENKRVEWQKRFLFIK